MDPIRGTDFFWLYSRSDLWSKYTSYNNYRDYNYMFVRRSVPMSLSDVIIVYKTSSHSYLVTHYRPLDGQNEIKRFGRLYLAAKYVGELVDQYDELYAAYLEEKQRAADAKKALAESRKAQKK